MQRWRVGCGCLNTRRSSAEGSHKGLGQKAAGTLGGEEGCLIRDGKEGLLAFYCECWMTNCQLFIVNFMCKYSFCRQRLFFILSFAIVAAQSAQMPRTKFRVAIRRWMTSSRPWRQRSFWHILCHHAPCVLSSGEEQGRAPSGSAGTAHGCSTRTHCGW
jgi:hypothetical protein